jgi:hypothetical protein
MRIKITKGGNFAHPNPAFAGRPHLRLDTNEVYDVDEEQGQMIVDLGRAELVPEREFEVRKAEVIEEPPTITTEEEEPPKKRRGRPPGKKRNLDA